MDASSDLYAFVFNAVRGICDDRDRVHVAILESPPRMTTLLIHCASKDAKFVQARLREIKIIAIAIGQRHKVIANVMLDN